MKWKFNLMVKFDWEKVDMVNCFLERFKEIMWQSLYISDISSTAGSIILRDRQGKLGSGDRSLLAGKTVIQQFSTMAKYHQVGLLYKSSQLKRF